MENATPVWRRFVDMENSHVRGWYDVRSGEISQHDPITKDVTARVRDGLSQAIPGYNPENNGVIAGNIQYGTIDLDISPGILPAPFDWGLMISGRFSDDSKQNYAKKIADYFVKTILFMLERRDDAEAHLKQSAVALEKRLAASGSGMTLKAMQIDRVRMADHDIGPIYTMIAQVSMIDDTLHAIDAVYEIRPQDRSRNTALGRDIKQQAARRQRAGGNEIVDLTLYHALQTMSQDKQEALYTFLRAQTNPDGNATNTWTAEQCLAQNIDLPVAIETIKSKDGILTGRVRLSENLIFIRNRFSAKLTLPETVAAHVAGRPIGEIIQHPWLPDDAPIIRCQKGEKGLTYITIEPAMVSLKTGKPPR